MAEQGRVLKLAHDATSFVASPDGTRIVFSVDQEPGQLWFVDTNTSVPLGGPVDDVEFSPDGRYVVVRYADDTPSELRRATDGAVVAQLARSIEDVAFSQYQTVTVRDSIGLSNVWNLDDRPYQLVRLGLTAQDVVIARTAQKIVVHYLLDAEWLRAIHSASAAPSIANLIRMACTGPLKSGLWTQDDQQAFEAVLHGHEEQACKE